MRRKRTHKAVKRPDLSGLKEAMKDGRAWCRLGIVLADDGEKPHFETVGGEVLVDVELQPSEEEITCVVSSPVGGSGVGVYAVPPVGSEVIVAIPDGEIVFQPTIVGVMAAEGPDGLDDTTLVIVAPSGGNILLHDGDNATESLARKSDMEALETHIDGHFHPAPLGPTGKPTVLSPVAACTSVLKGK
ncbi:MAG: hypothetical protein GY814_03595 [Gammaproteobacteria bacterium]|nr:hypothetical protein [Gammaproteobacteria bacterium]